MFVKKLQEFNNVRAGLKKIIEDLAGRKTELEIKIQQAKVSHEQALIADLEDGNKKTLAEISRLDRIIEDYEKELANVERRLEVANGLKQKRLSQLIPELKKFRDETIAESEKEIKAGVIRGFEEKARFILYGRDLNRPYKHAHDVNNFFLECCHAAGIHDYDRDQVHLPSVNLTGVYEGPHSSILPTEQEFKGAFHNGYVPAFVQLYELTGEVLPDDKARDRLNEKRNGGKR
jgi:hypothetical protein